jgi:diguanylate cyclase (GGDEF)-like protein
MERLVQRQSYNYWKLISVFLILTSLGIAVFFYCVQKNVEANTESAINADIRKQSSHFRMVLDIQYNYLEALADNIGRSDELLSDENMQLLQSLYESDNFERISIIEPDGTAHYDNHTTSDVSERRYFKEAISGSRTLSDPLESKADGTIRVVLGVPIFKDGDENGEVIGILAGSYDASSLSRLLFGDLYDGAGCFFMVSQNGEIVFEDDLGVASTGSHPEASDDFFGFYEQIGFRDGISIENLQADFEEQKSGCVEFEENGESFYLAYAPLKMNNWTICYTVPVYNAQGGYRFINRYEWILTAYLAIVFALMLFKALQENKRRQQDLLRASKADALTGVRNKKDTETEINLWLGSRNGQEIQALVMLDIDKFKSINEEHGHAAADEVLSQVGSVLRTYFRKDDIVGRVGGDEFIILMKNIHNCTEAADKAHALALRLNKIRVEEAPELEITGSMGVSFYPENGTSYRDLYKCANQALCVSKKEGGNGCTVYRQRGN